MPKLKFKDPQGATQEAEVGVEVYKEAADNSMTVPQLLNHKYPTLAEKDGTAFEQFMAQLGMFMHADQRFGIRPPTMEQVITGAAVMNAGVIVREANPASRILFPAVFLEAIENQLKDDTAGYVGAFNGLIAQTDSIQGARFEHPVLSYARPEAARSQGISQLALPASMLSITVSDVAKKIPTYSLGMEMSLEAMKATTLDFVALAFARQGEVERAERVDTHITALYSGDADYGMAALTGAVTAQSLDAAVTVAGTISHKAWIKWLMTGHRSRTIDYVFMGLDNAMAVENRANKPTVTTDNPTSNRIDALAQVINPAWKGVKIFLLEDGILPANTIVGIDSRYAIRKVVNAQAEYAAVEQYVLRKSEAVRYDFGEIVYRMFDDAFSVLTLTVA